MKRSTILFFILSIGFINFACDKIDEPFENKTSENGVDTTSNSTPTSFTNYSDTSVTIRKILIEDFTGHTCGNCPQAANIAAQLELLYGDTILVAAVHSGGFAKPQNNLDSSFATDFRTEAGNAYNTFWGNDIAGNPNGFVSRSKVINNDFIKQPDSWASAVEALKTLPADIKLEIGINYNAPARSLNTFVKTKALKDVSGNYKLVVYIIENKITDWQKDYSLPSGQQNVSDYEHNHVLRDVINDTWGETIINGSFNTGSATAKNYNNYILNSKWNLDNCHLIAYVYDATTYEIIQAEDIKLIP